MTCRDSGKIAYPTQKAADEGAQSLKRELGERGHIPRQQSVYRCPGGDHWHLAYSYPVDADSPGEFDVVKLRQSLRTKDERHLAITNYTALPEIELPAGTLGVILDISKLPDKPTGYLIEFADDEGRTIAWPHLPLEDFEVVERHRSCKGPID
ncbi:Uncharacterised protein [Mycobacteroides abscessus subsp. massiliense]|uniref:DUF4926 domain-containing protein n=1 Tax=Mycobacteroides abscessus TaxID=36809 RepID=UPI0009A7ADEB|nr:DUF4926 domain-containing protein [Mycobacteroides abscessus]SKT52873.1 Uncharacterised protein [Mycobacteroides abscessus subsp. massiliense]